MLRGMAHFQRSRGSGDGLDDGEAAVRGEPGDENTEAVELGAERIRNDGGGGGNDDDDHGGDAGEGEVLTMATIRKKRPAPHRRTVVDDASDRLSTATERSQESHDGEGQPEHAPQAAASTHGDDGDLRAIEQRLPDGWVSMESRSRAGQVVYAHSESGARIGEAPTLDTQRADRKDLPDLHAQRTVTLAVYVEGSVVKMARTVCHLTRDMVLLENCVALKGHEGQGHATLFLKVLTHHYFLPQGVAVLVFCGHVATYKAAGFSVDGHRIFNEVKNSEHRRAIVTFIDRITDNDCLSADHPLCVAHPAANAYRPRLSTSPIVLLGPASSSSDRVIEGIYTTNNKAAQFLGFILDRPFSAPDISHALSGKRPLSHERTIQRRAPPNGFGGSRPGGCVPSNKRSKGGFKSARGFGNEVALASFLVLNPIIREMKRRHHSKLLKIVEVIARRKRML